MHQTITDIISHIPPFDPLEADHIADTLAWINSGAPLFRLQPPDLPPKHLVSYFVLVDVEAKQLLLVDHIKAGLWLPTGGHVEPGEHPRATVRREVREELGIEAEFLADDPLFLTVTRTVGTTAGHTDVSLWYLLRGDAARDLAFDREEFNSVRWFDLDSLPLERSDPHCERFAAKILRQLFAQSAH